MAAPRAPLPPVTSARFIMRLSSDVSCRRVKHYGGPPAQYFDPADLQRELINDTALIAHELLGIHNEIAFQIIEPALSANDIPQAYQIAGLGPAADVAGQTAMHRHGLCRVFNSAQSGQLS